jgi:hypothetical protein
MVSEATDSIIYINERMVLVGVHMVEDFDLVMAREKLRLTTTGIEKMKMIMNNIKEFISYVDGNYNVIEDKLARIKAARSKDGRGAIVLDPTGKLFSLVTIEALGDIAPKVYVVRMEPPYIPHFLLILAGLYKRTGLIPSTLMRTEPVYSLVSLLVKGNEVAGAAAQAYAGIVAAEYYIMGEVVILPFMTNLLDLPVESENLYLTGLGFSTEPIEDSGFNVAVDLSEVLDLDEESFAKLNLKSLTDVLEDLAEVFNQ